MNLLERTIHAVGFGAFCSETFTIDGNSFHVVYDCGSKYSDMRARIVSEIDEIYNQRGSSIDVLFVSHFHEDHINCIKQLPITQSTLVVLPYIYDDYQLLFEFFHKMPYFEFIEWLKEIKCHVILVDPYDSKIHGNREGIRYLTGDHPRLDDNANIRELDGSFPHIKPFDYFHFLQVDWIYRPFHLQDKSVYEDFLKQALKKGFVEADFKNYDGKDSKLTQKMHKFYHNYCSKDKNAKKSLNASSILLVSQSVTNDVNKWLLMDCNYSFFRNYYALPYYYEDLIMRTQAACLYTGDTPLSTPYYETTFDTVKDRLMPDGITWVQLPHHGSVEGYNKLLLELPNTRYAFVNCMEAAVGRKGQPVLYTKAVTDSIRHDIPLFMVSEFQDKKFTCIFKKL